MTLTHCRECREQVSDEAKSCPHCGVPDPVGGKRPTESESDRTEGASSNSSTGKGCLVGGLVVISGIWGVIGVANIIISFHDATRTTIWEHERMASSLILNVLIFILPASILAGIVGLLNKR